MIYWAVARNKISNKTDVELKAKEPSVLPDKEYWTGAHTKHRLRFHLVWVPKYRKRLLQGALAQRLHDLLQEACQMNRWQMHEINIQSDHVHLLLQLSPTDSLPNVIQVLKGGTSRVLRSEFPEMQEFLWGKNFWAVGYFAETVGQVEEVALRRYIQNQYEPSTASSKTENPN